MAKQFERTMMCKNCGQVEIGQSIEDKKWYEVNNDSQLHYYKCTAAPHKKKSFTPRASTKGLDELAIVSEISAIKEQLTKHDEAIRALVKELSFKKGTEVEDGTS